MQSIPRILVNLLVKLKTLVNLLVKPTESGQGGPSGPGPRTDGQPPRAWQPSPTKPPRDPPRPWQSLGWPRRPGPPSLGVGDALSRGNAGHPYSFPRQVPPQMAPQILGDHQRFSQGLLPIFRTFLGVILVIVEFYSHDYLFTYMFFSQNSSRFTSNISKDTSKIIPWKNIEIKQPTYMQTNPRLSVNLLVILSILVNLLVKSTQNDTPKVWGPWGGSTPTQPLRSLSQAVQGCHGALGPGKYTRERLVPLGVGENRTLSPSGQSPWSISLPRMAPVVLGLLGFARMFPRICWDIYWKCHRDLPIFRTFLGGYSHTTSYFTWCYYNMHVFFFRGSSNRGITRSKEQPRWHPYMGERGRFVSKFSQFYQ